jgi:hypothetical protein
MNLTINQRIIAGSILAGVIALIMIGVGIERVGHRCPECPQCPEFVARSHIEHDSIIMHDTVRIVKYAPSIQVRTEPLVLSDSGADSTVVYEVIDTMPDAAIIGFSIASRELPDRRLPDLMHTAWYLAKPDRIRIISDTLTVQLPALKCPSRFWREVRIGGVCLGVGAIAATSYFYFR